MPGYVVRNADGGIENIIECTDEHAARLGLDMAGPKDRIGEVILSQKDIAARVLAEIDERAGMPRLMRETLIAIAGDKAPQRLKDLEAQAAAERLRLK
jgi:hypothetical protein